jgi:hypothetical protein
MSAVLLIVAALLAFLAARAGRLQPAEPAM